MSAPVVHFEIQASDPDRARSFYKDVFGWSDNHMDDMDDDYWLLTPTGEDPAAVAETGPSLGIGGGMLVRPGAPPEDGAAVNAYVCVLQVDDIDAIQAAIPEHGGKITVPPMDIPGIGRALYAKDTEGNLFGVIQPVPM